MTLLLINAPTVYENKYLGMSSPLAYIDVRKKFLKELISFYPLEPLGLLSIKAYCEQRNAIVHYYNGITQQDSTIQETLLGISKLKQKISSSVLLIGLTGASSVFNENLAIAQHCKTLWPNAKIILGSDFASLNYQKILLNYPEIDFVCVGDGELVTFALLEKLKHNDKMYATIAGLAWRFAKNMVNCNPAHALDLDDLPTVSRDDLPFILSQGFPVTIYTTRGCPFRCTFCTTGQVSRLHDRPPYRMRSMEKVLDEVESLYQKYKFKHLLIVDDLFLTRSHESKQRALQFGQGLIKRKIKLEYMFDTRLDCFDVSLYQKLYQTGLKQVFIGIESGDISQRQKYHKELKEEVPPEIVSKQLNAIGIKMICGMITFHAFLTVEELLETVVLLNSLPEQGDTLLAHKLIPYPGTPVYTEYQQHKLLNEKDWPEVTYEFQDKKVAEIYQGVVKLFAENQASFHEIKQFILGACQKYMSQDKKS